MTESTILSKSNTGGRCGIFGVIHVFTSSQHVQLIVQTGVSVQKEQSSEPAYQQ